MHIDKEHLLSTFSGPNTGGTKQDRDSSSRNLQFSKAQRKGKQRKKYDEYSDKNIQGTKNNTYMYIYIQGTKEAQMPAVSIFLKRGTQRLNFAIRVRMALISHLLV